MRRLIPFAVLSALLISACAQTPPAAPLPPIGFAGGAGVMKVDAPRIEVVDNFVPPMRAPNIEHELPISPAGLVKAWARDRLAAVGSRGEFRVVIRDASVIAEKLPLKGGIQGALTRQQEVRLNARIVAALEYSRGNGDESTVTVTVTRERTLSEGLSLAERDLAYYNFVKDLSVDLDRELQQNMASAMRTSLL